MSIPDAVPQHPFRKKRTAQLPVPFPAALPPTHLAHRLSQGLPGLKLYGIAQKAAQSAPNYRTL